MSVPASTPDDRGVDVLELFDDPVLGGLVKQALSMSAGDRMPSERDLATQFAVSRPTLRDRLGRLESMGLVERRGGAGTFVKGLSPKTFTEILTVGMLASGMTLSSLQVVRLALERQAAREAARAANPVKIAYMAAAVQRMERTEDPDELYAADVAFHRAMFDASESPSLIFFADVLSGTSSWPTSGSWSTSPGSTWWTADSRVQLASIRYRSITLESSCVPQPRFAAAVNRRCATPTSGAR